MKKIYLAAIAVFSILPFVSKAQNSNPWPTTGNVGIGTSSPTTIAGYSILSINNTTGGLLDLQSGGISKGYVYGNGGGLNLDANGNSVPMLFHTNGAEVMKITPAGFVGIGTTSPTERLDIGSGNFITTGYAEINTLAKNQIVLGSAGANFGFLSNNSTGVWSLGYGTTPTTLGAPVLSWNSTGKVGIGTTSPSVKLDVKSDGDIINGNFKGVADFFSSGSGAPGIRLGFNSSTNGGVIAPTENAAGAPLEFWIYNHATTGFIRPMTIMDNGKVGIGTTTPDELLSVNGTIHSKEVKVNLAGLPDYVFKPDYRLPTLSEVKNYIDKNSHLPEIPSAQEVEKNGLNLGEMNKLLLKKVEELTLYVIEQKTEIEKLERQIKNK